MSRWNPFTPGYDHIPPVFAGRERELSVFERLISSLASKAPADDNIILFGPRGNGKSTLLNYTYKYLIDHKTVHSIIVTPFELETSGSLHQLLIEKLGLAGESVSSISTLEKRCISTMAEHPTLLMVDEAHGITRDTMVSILSLASASQNGNTNFRFILAGTPDLPSNLEEMNMPCLKKAYYMRMERLDTTSTRKALFQPLEESGYNFRLTEAEEESLIEQTQRYPHFIQCAGHAIWDVMEVSDRSYIDASAVAAAKTDFEESVNSMYWWNLEELTETQLFDCAHVVALAFSDGRPSMYIEDIENTILQYDSEANVSDVLAQLVKLGYIWESGGNSHRFEPGLPSFMNLILDIVRDRNERARGLS